MQKSLIKKGFFIGIIVLFIGMGIIPSTAAVSTKSSILSFDGNILYVGGSGPGNYSRIRDAIEDASDGYTIFVYDDSSPYIEYMTLVIDKSINLIGENCYSTIIDNNNQSTLIKIYSDNVTISGFTLQNFQGDGIFIYFNDNIIISHNRIIDDHSMCIESHGSNIKIFSNEFTSLQDTVLWIWDGDNIEIFRNNFTECNDLFWLSFVTRTRVYENNFLSYKNAYMDWDGYLFAAISPLKIKFYKNYWYQPRLLPKPIFGRAGKIVVILSILFGYPIILPIPWVLFDYKPTKEPYDIH